MYKYHHKSRYKRYNKRRAKKSLQNRIRGEYNKYIKRIKYQNLPESLKEEYKESKGKVRIHVPSDYRLLYNTKEVLKFIERVREQYRLRRPIFINMRDVELIDFPAELVLVALLHRYKYYKIDFSGNFPSNESIKTHILTSDYFKHMRDKHDRISYVIGKPKQIFAKAERKVVSELPKVIIEDISKRWNISNKHLIFKGFYRTIIELMQNTQNHASTNNKYQEWWWLSQDLDRDKISFTFLDLGRGIIDSIKHKPKTDTKWNVDILRQIFLKIDNPSKILELLLKGEIHKYREQPYYRGKGLPGIYSTLERGQIRNLIILTNNVLADVEKRKFNTLNLDFNGTLVYFELYKPKTQ